MSDENRRTTLMMGCAAGPWEPITECPLMETVLLLPLGEYSTKSSIDIGRKNIIRGKTQFERHGEPPFVDGDGYYTHFARLYLPEKKSKRKRGKRT